MRLSSNSVPVITSVKRTFSAAASILKYVKVIWGGFNILKCLWILLPSDLSSNEPSWGTFQKEALLAKCTNLCHVGFLDSNDSWFCKILLSSLGGHRDCKRLDLDLRMQPIEQELQLHYKFDLKLCQDMTHRDCWTTAGLLLDSECDTGSSCSFYFLYLFNVKEHQSHFLQ